MKKNLEQGPDLERPFFAEKGKKIEQTNTAGTQYTARNLTISDNLHNQFTHKMASFQSQNTSHYAVHHGIINSHANHN